MASASAIVCEESSRADDTGVRGAAIIPGDTALSSSTMSVMIALVIFGGLDAGRRVTGPADDAAARSLAARRRVAASARLSSA
jgi:hypothetical protein